MIEYDPHDWGAHLFDIKGSMLREISARVLACVAFSVVIVAAHHFWRPMIVPSTVHGLVGVALGLLLVFRTNASYDRFWEGRKQWGAIVNESRNLARASRALLRSDPALHASVVRWTVAFAYSTMHNLRGQAGLGAAEALLPRAEVDAVLAAQHVPLAIAARISALLNEARQRGLLSDYAFVSLDQNVQLLVDYLGACERIHKTPLPFAYVVHLRRSLILYCFTLPFALVKDFGWWAIVATLLVAYAFFGIEEIGVEIEDPFGHDDNDLPLERICKTIEANLLSLIEGAPQAPSEELPVRPTLEGAARL